MATLPIFLENHQEGSFLIRSCRHGPKVIETKAGEIIKIFYPKNRLSSTMYYPYAERFRKNAHQLSRLAFNVPLIKSFYFCERTKIHMLSYEKLPGEDVCLLVHEGNSDILYDVIGYVKILHEKGVLFRAIHLSNLLCQGEKKFALVDIADVKIQRRSLSLYQRYRNLKHLFLYGEDRNKWEERGIINWLEYYCDIANLNFFARKILIKYFRYRHLR